MNETEIYKIVLNNGFMALFVVWVLFKGEPRYRELIDKITTTNAATIEALMRSHEANLAAIHKECREERRELLVSIAKENELNRVSRHEFGNRLQEAINEIYNNRMKDLREKRTKPEHNDKPQA